MNNFQKTSTLGFNDELFRDKTDSFKNKTCKKAYKKLCTLLTNTNNYVALKPNAQLNLSQFLQYQNKSLKNDDWVVVAQSMQAFIFNKPIAVANQTFKEKNFNRHIGQLKKEILMVLSRYISFILLMDVFNEADVCFDIEEMSIV